jgi:hypothetical protein
MSKPLGFPMPRPTGRPDVITKHPGTGAFTVDTVKAQLLYEIQTPRTPTPTRHPVRLYPAAEVGPDACIAAA